MICDKQVLEQARKALEFILSRELFTFEPFHGGGGSVVRWKEAEELAQKALEQLTAQPITEQPVSETHHLQGKHTTSEWIKWNGGECPVDKNILVEVEFRDGSTSSRAYKAGVRSWMHHGYVYDIVAYRIIGKE